MFVRLAFVASLRGAEPSLAGKSRASCLPEGCKITVVLPRADGDTELKRRPVCEVPVATG